MRLISDRVKGGHTLEGGSTAVGYCAYLLIFPSPDTVMQTKIGGRSPVEDNMRTGTIKFSSSQRHTATSSLKALQ